MATHHPRARILRFVTLAHQSGPQTTPGTKLGNLLEEIVMDIKKEREAWSKFIDLQTTSQCSIDISQAIGNSKGQFLHGCCPGLADVIAADADGIPKRHM